MAWKPVSVFKRPTTKKGQFRYYIKLWDESRGAYSSPRSVAAVALETDAIEGSVLARHDIHESKRKRAGTCGIPKNSC